MTVRKTIAPTFVILLAACFLITLIAFADEGQPIDEEYAPGFYYTVQKGDTLWDLSRKFYDSEWQWPAMWGQNTDLTNPHMIYPGQLIRLLQRTDALKGPGTIEETTEDRGLTEEATAPALSFTESVYYLYPAISYVGFIKKLRPTAGLFEKSINDPEAIGVVLKAEGEKRAMISQNDTVYITPKTKDTSSFIVGERYYVYPPLTPVSDPITNDYAGHQYKIAGTAEVTFISPEYIKAKIIKAFDTINAGFFIMPFEKRDKKIAIVPSPPGLTGEILMAQNDEEMSCDYSIVFINKGEKDGVQPGQRYDIYYQDKHETEGKEMLLSKFVYGEMLVLLTKQETATAIITKSIKPVRRGDLFKSAL